MSELNELLTRWLVGAALTQPTAGSFAGEDSFPSAHAAAFFALAFAVRLYRQVVGNFLIFVALAVSAARVAALLHWPSDLLGGFLLARLVAFVLRSLVNYLRLRPAGFRL